MAWEAVIVFDLSTYSSKIADIIAVLNKSGWCFSNGYTEYLPLHDNDNFDWQKEALSDEDFFRLFQKSRNSMNYAVLCFIINILIEA